MPNPLDMVTQDDSLPDELQGLPDELQGLPRVFVRPDALPAGGNTGTTLGDNKLVQQVAPEQPNELMQGIAALKEYLLNGQFSPGTKVGNKLFGTGGEERYQTWPERMVRSGASLPGDVLSGAEPIVDPATGRTSERVIERAQDTAGLAGGSALIERPGAGTLGSGPVRPAMPREQLFPALLKDGRVYKGLAGVEEHAALANHYFGRDLDKLPDVDTGFVDHRGRFLSPDKAAEYAVSAPHLLTDHMQKPENFDILKNHKFFTADMLREVPLNRAQLEIKTLQDQAQIVLAQERQAYQDKYGKPLGFSTREQGEVARWKNSDDNPFKGKVDEIQNRIFETARKGGQVLRSDTQQPGAAISGAAGSAPVFYSALEHAATNAVQDTMSPQQWLGYLKNQPGVKQEELNWTGIGDWLGQQKGKVSKNEVQNYLDGHKVEIKDVTKHAEEDGTAYSNHEYDAATEHALERMGDEFSRLPEKERAKWDDDIDAWLEEPGPRDRMSQFETDWLETNAEGTGGPNYSSYQLPGGENYREHLLTLPHQTERAGRFEIKEQPSFMAEPPRYHVIDKDGVLPNEEFKTRAHAEKWLAHVDKDKTPGKDPYRSSHWDEPNVLAHVRTNDRTMERMPTAEQIAASEAHRAARGQLNDLVEQQRAVMGEIQNVVRPLEMARRDKIRADVKAKKMSSSDGIRALEEYYAHPEIRPLQDRLQQLRTKEDVVRDALPVEPKVNPIKSLHIEEIQSDWHQQGRKQGYKGGMTEKDIQDVADAMLKRAKKNHQNTYDQPMSKADQDQMRALYEKDIRENSSDLERHSFYLPDLKNRDRGVPDAPFKTTWPELALKRMIRHAAENGYDRISWTPGEAQAARYDLSKQIERLAYDPESNRLVGFAKGNKGNTPQIDKKVAPDKLADEIGKEAADKILNAPSSKGKLPMFPGEYNHLENADLKVGGEGMREFYDKMLPRMAEKIGKAHGVKVKTTEATKGGKEQLSKNILSHPNLSTILDEMQYNHPTRAGWSEEKAHKFLKDLARSDPEKFVKQYEKITGNYDDPHMKISAMDDAVPALHYFDLPQSLKDHAIGKGFPLYMSGVPFPLTPVDHDPFKKEHK